MIDIGDLTTRNAWRSPGRDAIIDVPNGRRLSFAQLEGRANRLAHGLREELGLHPESALRSSRRTRPRSRRPSSPAPRPASSQCRSTGALRCPSRRGSSPTARPRALIHNREFAGEAVELQRRNDIAHWIEFAPGSDSPYEELLAPRPGGSSFLEHRDRRERPVLHPLHRRHHRHVEGRSSQPRVVLRGHGQPGRGGADRRRRRLHAARPDVPHPRRARDDLPRPRQAGRADELRARARRCEPSRRSG